MENITFPWEQLGGLLREMSLAGGFGNAAAWACYLAAGAAPLLADIFLLYRRRAVKADLLLPLLSAVLYGSLWFFVNPSYMNVYLSPMPAGGFGKYALGAGIYGVLLAWLLLRFLSAYEKLKREKLLKALKLLLGGYVVLSAAAALFQGGQELASAFRSLEEGNTGVSELGFSYFFLTLQTAADKLPELLELALFVMVIGFLHSCREENFGEDSLRQMKELKKCSSLFVAVVLLANVGVNLLQLIFARFVYCASYKILFPLKELIVMLGILMLSRFYLESRRIKEDNDMII